jgi:TonB family protein
VRGLLPLSIAGLLSIGAAPPEEGKTPPLSPGSVALLVGHASDPAAVERWGAALQDSDARVRAAAARTVNVSGAVSLIEGLRRALAAEQDQDAADEEMLALAALGGKEVDDFVVAAGRRFGEHGVSTAAGALARARGPEALSSLPALREAELAGYDTFYLWSTRGGTQGLTAAGSIALRDRDLAEWEAVLGVARRPGASLDPGVLLAALSDPKDPIRAATFWHLALIQARDGKLDGRVGAAVAAALDAERPTDVAVALTLELLGRALGRRPTEQVAWVAALVETKARAPYATRLQSEKDLLAKLERREIEALSVATRGNPQALRKPIERKKSASANPDATPRLRTPDSFPRGFVAGVLAAAGCDPRAAHGWAIAQIAYGQDGRPRQVQVVGDGPRGPLGKPPTCEQAARVLLATDLAEDVNRLDEQTVLIVLEPDPLTCLAEEAPRAAPVKVLVDDMSEEAQPRAVTGAIKEPRKIKTVNPVYPEAARQRRVEGVVVLDAILRSTGCVRSLEVVDGVRVLNLESIRAVSQWRYTPTLLNGVPVPVIMAITVNYHLR